MVSIAYISRCNWWYNRGYFAVRRDDPIMAKRILILGIVIFAIGLLISLMTPVEVPIPSTNTNN